MSETEQFKKGFDAAIKEVIAYVEHTANAYQENKVYQKYHAMLLLRKDLIQSFQCTWGLSNE